MSEAAKSDKNPSKSPAEGELRFDVDSALLFELGEALVTKRSVAMGELIKNAYDADATQVIIEFKRITAKGGEITILDDGSGIPFERLQSTWMRIATTEKVDQPVSPRFGRPKVGAKGIGRFATRRLADKLELVTTASVDPEKPRRGKEETRLAFLWHKFEPGKDIGSVPVRYHRVKVPDEQPTGVLLRLQDVKEAWTDDDVRELRKDILALISPLPNNPRKRPGAEEKDPGFDVHFEFGDQQFEDYSGSVAEDFLEHGYAVLEGTLSKTGKPTYSIRFSDSPADEEPETFEPESRFPNVGPAHFTVHFFVYQQGYFAGMEFNARGAAQLGRQYGGVQIHYDGFRVPPYGNRGDDWLRLDYDRGRRLSEIPVELRDVAKGAERPMLSLPGNNQVFGQVSLTRTDNPDIRQLANREGFQENVAFQQLREFVRLGINWLTVMYARHTVERRRERKSDTEKSRTPAAVLAQAQTLIEALPERVTPEQRKEASQAIRLAIESIQEREAEHIGELQMLRVLASTGTMILVFDHQLLGILEGLRDTYRRLQTFVKSLPSGERERFTSTLTQLDGWIEDARQQSTLLGLLMGKKARTRKQRVAIRPVADKIVASFSSFAAETRIIIENQVPPALRTPLLFECELSAILINLLTNAMKAVKLATTRRIDVGGFRENGDVVVQVKDTGVGAKKSKWTQYFEPFFSESEPDPILGTGTGLGLKIVADFVDVYGGTARFVDPEPPWATCIEFRLPE